MAINKSWNLDLFNPLLSGIADDTANTPDVLEKIVKTVDTSDRGRFPLPDQVIDSEYAGFGTMADLDDEGTPAELQPKRGYPLTTTYRQKGGKIIFSRLILEDDLTGITKDLVKKLAESYKKTRNYQAASVYVRASDSTNTRYLGRDGKPLIAVDHPTAEGGGAVRYNTHVDASGNYSAKAFGYESMQDLIVAMGRHTDMLGDPDPLFTMDQSIRVMVQYEDMFEYLKLLGELAQYEPISNSNAPNVLKSAAAFDRAPIMNPYLNAVGSDSTIRPYFVFGQPETGIELMEREKYFGHQYLQDGNLSMVHMGMGRYDFRVATYKGVFAGGF